MICTIQKISKMLGGNTIFENLSLEIKTGDKLGIIGRNGSGKTTLFKLISGIEQPDNGALHFKKETKIGYLAQIPSFEKEITGYDILHSAFEELIAIQKKMTALEIELANPNTDKTDKLLHIYGDLQEEFARRDGYIIDSEIDKIINGLQLQSFVRQPFGQLSGGEQTKVMLGKLLLTKPDLLLLDEPTNHLDLFAMEWLEAYLTDYLGTVVIVSHDRYFLDAVVTKIADLEEGELHLYYGDYSAFIQEKETRLMKEFQDYEEQQKKMKKMKEAIKRLHQWANEANPPNAGLHRQARNMERAMERMTKIRRPLMDPKKMALSFEASQRSGKEVVVLEGITKSFGQKRLLTEADFHVYWKDRTAIVGRNGSGKSTVLKILLGEIPVDAGLRKLGSNVNIGFLSQHFEIKDPKARLIDVFRQVVHVDEGKARHILAKFMFYGPDVFKRIGDLSGGERMRLRLVQLMHQDINFLVLDEPTNHLDIESREVLEEALEDFTGTIVAVSHDRYFLNKLFPRTAWLENGVITTFEGPYQWARDKQQEIQDCKETKIIETSLIPKTKKVKEIKPINLEEEIAKLELTITSLKKDVESTVNQVRFEALLSEIDTQEEKLASYYEIWMDEVE